MRILIVLLLFLHQGYASESPIQPKKVWFFSPPRSLSTAFLRMIQSRGDFQIIHEPLTYAYKIIHHPEWSTAGFRPEAPQSYEAVKTLITETASLKWTFIKEMGFVAKDFFLQFPELLHDENTYFVFLVRNPHHSFISHYRKSPSIFDGLTEILSYQTIYDFFQTIKGVTVHPPLVISAEDLYLHPREVVKQFCEHVGIPLIEGSLSWPDLGEQFSGQEEWYETKFPAVAHHWHGEAIRSTGFGIPSKYELDAKGLPTFTEIENLEHRAVYQKLYEDNLPYYHLFLSERLWNGNSRKDVFKN